MSFINLSQHLFEYTVQPAGCHPVGQPNIAGLPTHYLKNITPKY